MGRRVSGREAGERGARLARPENIVIYTAVSVLVSCITEVLGLNVFSFFVFLNAWRVRAFLFHYFL